MARPLPENPSLEHLSKQAKTLLKAARAGDAAALAMFSKTTDLKLSDAQYALARDYGFESWPKLHAHVVAQSPEPEVHDHVKWFGAFHQLGGPVSAPIPVNERLEHEVDALLNAHAARQWPATVPLRFYSPGMRDLSAEDILDRDIDRDVAQEAVAQTYLFPRWSDAVAVTDVIDPKFERAVDSIVTGDLATLRQLLSDHPELVEQHSPFGHRSTLLHYVSANGVENYRQRTPQNIVDITRALLAAGAKVDEHSAAYGGGPSQTPLCLTVSSGHPHDAGVQADIAAALLEAGAAINGVLDDGMPLNTALSFGYRDTAEFLVDRGARVDNLVVASALGRMDLVQPLLDKVPQRYCDPFGAILTEPQDLLNRAFYGAAQQGHVDLARLLLDGGAEVDTPYGHNRSALHWAAYAGNTELVELLLERGADPTRKDSYYDATPAQWAEEGGHTELVARLQP